MIKTVRIAAILSIITAVTACGSTTTRPVALDAPPPEATDLPAVALSPDLLYSLLLGEIAGQRGQLDVALASLKRAALASRDPRLAERATLVGL